MWLNKYEKKIIGPFYDFIFKNIDRVFVFQLNDDAIVEVMFETESEMDNNLEPNDINYEEYRESYFKICKVVKDDSNCHFIGQIIFINYHCLPKSYTLK